jgi:hypothetical protein
MLYVNAIIIFFEVVLSFDMINVLKIVRVLQHLPCVKFHKNVVGDLIRHERHNKRSFAGFHHACALNLEEQKLAVNVHLASLVVHDVVAGHYLAIALVQVKQG